MALAAPEVQPAAQITEPERLPDPFIQARIAKAKEYLAKGYITAPPIENAVTQLELALYREPTNAEALELMSIAAQRMLAAAETAKQAGFDFEARNLLEELLAFHPEHVEANRLWREWLDEPAPFQ